MSRSTLQVERLPEPNIDAILQQVRSGNVHAFSEIITQFYAPIRWYVFARCPIGGDPEGVVQRIFLAALNEIESYQPGTDFRAWLFTMARFEVMTESTKLRREMKNRSQHAKLALAEAVERASLDEEPSELPWLEALKQCMKDLNQDHQELLKMRYESSQSLQQIATSTNRSEGSLKKAFFAIRNRLRMCIERRVSLEQA